MLIWEFRELKTEICNFGFVFVFVFYQTLFHSFSVSLSLSLSPSWILFIFVFVRPPSQIPLPFVFSPNPSPLPLPFPFPCLFPSLASIHSSFHMLPWFHSFLLFAVRNSIFPCVAADCICIVWFTVIYSGPCEWELALFKQRAADFVFIHG